MTTHPPVIARSAKECFYDPGALTKTVNGVSAWMREDRPSTPLRMGLFWFCKGSSSGKIATMLKYGVVASRGCEQVF